MNRKQPCDPPQTDAGKPVDKPVSLAPLTLKEALSGLLAVGDPDATKPKHEKARRKGKARE
jgi:hypothetical protein